MTGITEKNDGRQNRKNAVRHDRTGVVNPKRSAALRRRYLRNPEQREVSRRNAKKNVALGIMGRPLGSYDGVSKPERIAINARAKQIAEETILKMADQGILTNEDDPRAVKALQAAVEVMNTPANQQTKLAAARLILDYTKSKPASKSEVTVNKAEEWLAAVNREESDAEGPAEDTEEATS